MLVRPVPDKHDQLTQDQLLSDMVSDIQELVDIANNEIETLRLDRYYAVSKFDESFLDTEINDKMQYLDGVTDTLDIVIEHLANIQSKRLG